MEEEPLEDYLQNKNRKLFVVARTTNINEANRIAKEYELQGFTVNIDKSSRGSVELYTVSIFKEPDGFLIK